MDVVAIDKLPELLCDLNLKHIIEKGYLEAGSKWCSIQLAKLKENVILNDSWDNDEDRRIIIFLKRSV